MIQHTTAIVNDYGSMGITFPVAYYGVETEIQNISPSGTIYFGGTVEVSDINYEFALLPNEKMSLGTTPRNDLYAIGELPQMKLAIFSDTDEYPS
jgi:hypothetical protein